MLNARRRLLLAGLAAAVSPTIRAESTGRPDLDTMLAGSNGASDVIDLWSQGVPGKPKTMPHEIVVERSTDRQINDRHIAGISRPRILLFRPSAPNGASILIAPGGGYRWVVIDREGIEMARWFAERGVTAFVLFYRLPGDGWAAGPNVALADAQRAMRLIRHRAAQWGLDAKRVAAMGFSAGGHLCADLIARHATRIETTVDGIDELSAKPFLGAPIYPVVTMSAPYAHAGSREQLIGKLASNELESAHSPHRHISREVCPVFLLHAEDDASVPVENTLLLRAALREKGVSVETHLFKEGGHGFGLRKAAGKPVEAWSDLLLAWARSHGWF